MFVTLHDNMRNARDTKQAVNGSLSIFLCVPFLELMMERYGPFCGFFPIICATGTLSSKQNGGTEAKAKFELH